MLFIYFIGLHLSALLQQGCPTGPDSLPLGWFFAFPALPGELPARVPTGPKMKAEFCFFFWRLDFYFFLLFLGDPQNYRKAKVQTICIFHEKIISPDQ